MSSIVNNCHTCIDLIRTVPIMLDCFLCRNSVLLAEDSSLMYKTPSLSSVRTVNRQTMADSHGGIPESINVYMQINIHDTE